MSSRQDTDAQRFDGGDESRLAAVVAQRDAYREFIEKFVAWQTTADLNWLGNEARALLGREQA